MQQRQQQQRAARAAPRRGCVGRHLANNGMRVFWSDSYALLFLFKYNFIHHKVAKK